MAKEINEFTAESLGHCFLCLKKMSHKLNELKYETDSEPFREASIYSLKHLSNYLKMDLKKVFNDDNAIPAKLLAKVEKSRLKVYLCDNCGPISTKLINLIQQLEKIQMEIISYLKTFQEKLLTGDADELFKHLIKYDLNSNAKLKSKLEIMSILRDEALKKCSNSLTQAAPRVKIQKLTRKEINTQVERNNLYFQENCENSNQNNFMRMEPSGQNIKVEEISTYESGEDYTADSKFEADDVELAHPHFKTSTEDEGANDEDSHANLFNKEIKIDRALYTIIQGGKQITNESGQLKFIMNPATGKHQCSMCSREFKRLGHAKDHFRSTHMKLKYRCKACHKVFRQVASFGRHYRTDHACVNVKCKKCNKLFTHNSYLLKHLEVTHSQVRKHVCPLCGFKFKLKCHLKRHLRTVHSLTVSKIKYFFSSP